MFQNKSIQFAFLTVWLIGLGACVPPHVPVIDVSKISDSDRIAAANIRVFSFGQQPPKIKKVIGQIKSFSCKHLTWTRQPHKAMRLSSYRYRRSMQAQTR